MRPTEPDLVDTSVGSRHASQPRGKARAVPRGQRVIVIIGAGVSGLGIGWKLAEAGRAVTVIDRGPAGRGASWAAAGMLAPQVEAEPGEEALLPLMLESQALWAEFAPALERASGTAIGYR